MFSSFSVLESNISVVVALALVPVGMKAEQRYGTYRRVELSYIKLVLWFHVASFSRKNTVE